ncbi:hypothetical protein [Gemmata obscuriglobus]|uniref:Uncharacterized protein n=1 Tax=Gemmata obscuriglobus TaxID=114 RepID=A0A2Z3GVH6_9BACT|nr:hypothetical protein [Gemmata obscuriglobus]AWM37308.1 hypothetical protein C1280_09905 [Gemmata obscuriglobus]
MSFDQAAEIPPGWYRVALTPAPTPTSGPASLFPTKLARPDMSGIEREVKPGKEHIFEFVVEVPKE